MAINVAQSSFNTTTLQNLIMTTTTTAETVNVYDHQGAALYIAVILVWYSTGLAMMLFLQVRPRTFQQQFLLDSSYSSPHKTVSSTTNPFANYRNVQADNTTKQILNELKDPERRQRLWKIYYASSEQQHEHHPQYYQTVTSDSATINRIKRKLADIHRMSTRDDHNGYAPPHPPMAVANSENPSTFGLDSSNIFSKRFAFLRRSAGMTNGRSPLVRAQSQNDSAVSTTTAVEMYPLVTDTTTASVARKNNNNSPNRFKIEKVPENLPITTGSMENLS